MAGLGIGVFFVGYSVFYYGLSQVTSHNYGFLDLVVPSKWAAAELSPPPTDGGLPSGPPGLIAQAKSTAISNIPAAAKAYVNPIGSFLHLIGL